MHWDKDSGFYPIYELFRSAHIIFSDTAIYRKHSDIYRRRCVLQQFHFGQEVSFGLAYLLRSGFLAPMPVVQVAGVEDAPALEVYQERDAYVRGAECFDADMLILVDVTFINIGSIFCRSATMFQNIL